MIKAGVDDSLKAVGDEFRTVPCLNELFCEDSLTNNPFQGIATESEQCQYYLQHLKLVVSVYFFLVAAWVVLDFILSRKTGKYCDKNCIRNLYMYLVCFIYLLNYCLYKSYKVIEKTGVNDPINI